MKQKKSVYLYQDGEYIGFFQSMTEASKYTKEGANVILDVVKGKRKLTRKGYHYSETKLTQEEMDALPKRKVLQEKTIQPRYNNECKQLINGYDYEVACADHKVTYQARSKEQRIKQFKFFIYQKLEKHWDSIPKAMVNLEKIYINEFLDSVS